MGTFLGWSAITMSKICKKHNLSTKILCVDTWLGSIEHWRKDLCNSLHQYDYFSNGTSIMYDQFCKNVISHELQDYIIGLPNTTKNIHKFLSFMNISADLIYVDASHEYDDVVEDLTLYYELLKPNGYIFGDDVVFSSVKSAAMAFSNFVRKPIQFSPNNQLYYIQK